jgi:restriction endonuclease Mrr
MADRRGRRRHELVMTAWATSVIVTGVVVVALLEATHGLVLLLLAIAAVLIWRKSQSTKRRAESRERAARAAAELNRTAREAAERQLVIRPTATKDNPAGASRERTTWTAPAERARAGGEAEDSRYAAGAATNWRDPDVILRLSPPQFENAMVELLRMLGMRDVQRVGGRYRLTLDLTAQDPLGRTMLARCKRYARGHKAGAPDIQQLISMDYVGHHADVKLFVTTSDFTPGARDLAGHHDIELMNGSQIEELASRRHTGV